MADSAPTGFRPHSYRRVCDVCGNLRPIEEMHRQDDLWVCTYDAGERVRTQLDRANARQRPFQIRPVPNPKPQNPYYPNTLETDDDAVFNFLSKQVDAQCRFEHIDSGYGPYTSVGLGVSALSWAGRYFYDLIQENERRTALITRAKAVLKTIADYLLTRQYGSPTGLFPTLTATNSCFYGGIIESGATLFITEDVATGGLAMLYAYRIHGTTSYLNGARAAASYLRNVQAIGSKATQHTSSDSTGTSRLYTGAVCSQVSTITGVDPGDRFYSDHRFYPSGLLALEFWNELKTTDGDQTIGATAAVDGFDSTPSQLLSQSIADMRDCWSNGITDSTATLINGLSSSTPREFFNAYPATKTGFTNVTGTGRWEFFDGGASTGTQVTSQTFGRALSALYNYEGLTTQVTTISDWLRGFTSNPAFETAASTPDHVLYHATTGTYDPTLTISTLLTVRDSANSYADTAINGSSLYDWGAFGLLSRIWASRNKASFLISRLVPLGTFQRFFDNTWNDGLAMDRVSLRGQSGLSMQTGFSVTLGSGLGSDGGTSPQTGGTSGTLPSTGAILHVKGNSGLQGSGSTFVRWLDSAGQHQDLDVVTGGTQPSVGLDTIDGIPCVTFSNSDIFSYVGHTGSLKDRNGVAIPYTSAITVMAVFKPTLGASTVVGGPIFSMATQPNFEFLFDVEAWFTHLDAMFVFDNLWKLSGFQILAPDTHTATWASNVTLGMWHSSGYPNIAFAADAGNDFQLRDQAGTNTTNQGGGTGTPPTASFLLGNCWDASGAIQQHNFHGAVAELVVWDYELTGATRTQAASYFATAYPSLGISVAPIGIVNDAVLSAQFARSFREARN